MKIERLLQGLFCAVVAGVLFTIAHRLVGGFRTNDTIGSTGGVVILLGGCWALARAMWSRWLKPRKKKAALDLYTAARVEMEMENQKMQAKQDLETKHPR